MNKVNIITPPDILHNKSKSFLLVQPSENIRNQFNALLGKFEEHVNVYLYDPAPDEETDLPWLINVANLVDYIILDIDNMDYIERNFVSYFVSLPKTFYLTNSNEIPYSIISVNRIYNLDWLYENIKKED
jgi:hypothetical protein